jgi:hypothetical protein
MTKKEIIKEFYKSMTEDEKFRLFTTMVMYMEDVELITIPTPDDEFPLGMYWSVSGEPLLSAEWSAE